MRQRPLKPLRQQINDLFHLHTGERRGFLLMMALLILLSGWVVLEQWFLAPERPDLDPIRARMEAWAAERRAAESKDRIEHEHVVSPLAPERWAAGAVVACRTA